VCVIIRRDHGISQLNCTMYSANLTELAENFGNCVITLVGDFSQFDMSRLLANHGLSQLITKPTRNNRMLDRFITNRLDLFSVTVALSVLLTDHLAVYVSCFLKVSVDKPDL
jgi:hypothetical protein